jgi:hypothetical protein
MQTRAKAKRAELTGPRTRRICGSAAGDELAIRGVRRDLLVLVEHHRGVRPLLRIDTDNRLDGAALLGPT